MLFKKSNRDASPWQLLLPRNVRESIENAARNAVSAKDRLKYVYFLALSIFANSCESTQEVLYMLNNLQKERSKAGVPLLRNATVFEEPAVSSGLSLSLPLEALALQRCSILHANKYRRFIWLAKEKRVLPGVECIDLETFKVS
jgi:hypothetical protein